MNSFGRQTVYRILDANFNRGREALRVLEEYCRFALNDESLTETTKNLRHELANAAQDEELGDGLCQSRDIVRDVGASVSAGDEYVRADTQAVATAAAKRAAEAIRSIEEYAKAVSSVRVAKRAESIRYQLYELERRIGLLARARRVFGHVRLYVIITESYCSGRWQDVAAAAIRGGAECLQLREKGLSDRELLSRAREFVRICRDGGALAVINDRCDIAIAAEADGVHIGQDDMPIDVVRGLLPPAMLLGVSTHTAAQAVSVSGAALDYVAIGPMFSTDTKPRDFVAGIEVLAEVRSSIRLPVVAIGGIDANRAPGVVAAGADCLCVCTSVIASEEVEVRARQIRAMMDQSEV